MEVPGFVNTGLPGKRSCDTLRYNSTVGVQKSFHLNDDIHQIAMALDSHPIVDYPDEMMNDPDMRIHDIVDKTWSRLEGSSVWLPEQKVYLSVTRIVFSPSRTRVAPKMSFMRGQLFTQDWEHLDNYTISCAGKSVKFPTVFDLPDQWEDDGSMFGPEDPQVIMEEGVDGAEPVVIFNMVGRKSDWKRAMYLYRPFSGSSTLLTIKDTERAYNEKNWAPFFIPNEEQQMFVGKIPLPVPTIVRKPNEYIHFVYSFKPLRILKCHMRCGDCEFEYEQDIPGRTKHHEEAGSLRGGTNFVPVPIPSSMNVDRRVQVYVGFPQTNIEKVCDGSFYRPGLAVLINIGKQFQLAYASESLDFGSAFAPLGPEDDPCDQSRVLIPNSISRWDTGSGRDVMSLTLSANEETVQVARLHGLLSLIQSLPQFKTLLRKEGLLKGADSDLVDILSSWVGDDVRGCLLESAQNFTGVGQGHSDDFRDEEQEMDLSKELAETLRANAADEEKRKKEKQNDPEIGRDYDPGVPTLEHPPADEDDFFHPDLLGEFEDVEGLSVDGLDDVVKDNSKKEDPKKDEEKKGDQSLDEGPDFDIIRGADGKEEKKVWAFDKDPEEKVWAFDKDQDDKENDPLNEDKKAEVKNPEKEEAPAKEGGHGHHRYHKHQNNRRMWP